MNRVIPTLLLFCLWALLPMLAEGQEQKTKKVPPGLTKKVEALSGTPSLSLAKKLGITKIAGKDLADIGPPGRAGARKLGDVPVGADPTRDENEPTVTANPKNPKRLVAGSHWWPDPVTGANRCVAYYSTDGGQTWSDPFPMPQLPANTDKFCSDPVLAYAPDGSRVYYAYMDIKQIVTENPPIITIQSDFDILVSWSDDDGVTWSAPVIALNGDPSLITFNMETGELLELEPGYDFDKNWVSTHVEVGGKQDNADWVYVTATRFDTSFESDCHIAFTRSGDRGQTWSAPQLLESSPGCFNVVQGSRPSGGPGSDVLVGWLHSGYDGWLVGAFEIHTAFSSNNGAAFNPVQAAAVDNFEAPFWLGPFLFYKRWWGTMFPDVELDPGGAAHIIYTHDPEENPIDPEIGPVSLTPEDGDIRYVYSAGPPYTSWSNPVTINDDGLVRAQGYAALETQHVGKTSTLHVIWEDTRLTPDLPIMFFPANISPNLYYDIFYSRKTAGGSGWQRNIRVTDESSLQDWIFTGDYTDLTALNGGVFGIFTDRRDKSLPSCFPEFECGPPTGIYDFEDDVYGSHIIPGGGTPQARLAAGGGEQPSMFILEQNHPNPFNPTTVIAYSLPEAGPVQLSVYNVQGQEVARLVDNYQEAGRYEVPLDASHLSAGVYLYTIRTDGFVATRRMVLLK